VFFGVFGVDGVFGVLTGKNVAVAVVDVDVDVVAATVGLGATATNAREEAAHMEVGWVWKEFNAS